MVCPSTRTTSFTPCGRICYGVLDDCPKRQPPTTRRRRAPTTRLNARFSSEPAPRPRHPVGERLGFAMKVHLVDGTYELFRHFFGAPSHRNADGHEVAAVRSAVGSVLGMLIEGATHIGVATDHVIESFRNE